MKRVELAVVGAGPAGLAAALAADQAGVTTLLLDALPRAGGQYFRQAASASSAPPGDRRGEARLAALSRLAASRVETLYDRLVWGIFPAEGSGSWELAIRGPDGQERVIAQAIILATGAYDRTIPFPRWTLPGVMTAGGVQAVLKGHRTLPGRRILLSGSGPLQIAVAAELVRAGAEVVAVLEAAKPLVGRSLRQAGALWGNWNRLIEGWGYLRTLRAQGVPIRLGWTLVEAKGARQVEAAVICPLDKDGWPVREAAESVEADAIAIGFGLIPSTELARLAGCAHEYRPQLGGYVPKRNAGMETTVAGIYAAGDGAGIGGAEMAQIEGRIAGVAAAARLGKLAAEAAQNAIAAEGPALARQQRFARMLSALFTPGAGLYSLATDETPICRCEEVTFGEVRRAVTEGAGTANEVKGLTRMGMGNCQGRICGDLVAHIIAAERGETSASAIEAAGSLRPRPPLHPLTLADLAES